MRRSSTLFPMVALALSREPARAQGQPAPNGSIEVTVTAVRPEQGGSLVVALFRGPEKWLQLDAAFAQRIVPATTDSITLTLDSIPFDTSYAVEVLHDRNDNRKLDMRWLPFPKPKEGSGVSNNVLRRGPPEYARAAFALDAPVRRVQIALHY